MPRIAIVTDSVACLSPEQVKKYNIYVAPVQITWDRVTYRDGITITPEEFYKRLRTSKTLPTTSSAIQGEFMQIYEQLKGKVDGIVTLVLSGSLGACLDSAKNAREIVNSPNTEIVDTRTAMSSQAFIVLEAAKASASGASIAEVVAAANAAIPKTGVFWAMDTLEYLRKGGRISLPQSLMASWLHVKPITSIEDGKVKPLAKTISKARAIEKALAILHDRVGNYHGRLHLAIVHGDVPEEADRLETVLSERFEYCELLRSEITPVIGTHVGPGAIGLGYYME
jgi:DegV family protein with EDD domain